MNYFNLITKYFKYRYLQDIKLVKLFIAS